MTNSLNYRRILESIRPSSLELVETADETSFPGLNSLIYDFSVKDLGRGMLNHKKFSLVETLPTFQDDQESYCKEKVYTSNLDNVILSLSLKAYLRSKETRHSNDIAVLIPTFSYSFSLLMAYQLILQHLAETISPELNAKFPPGTGILIISDNIELYSHIGRTSIQNHHLWQYVNTFEVKKGRFNPFSFSKEKKNKFNYDGSLPWISLLRAVRHELPEDLDMTPHVIILDLLPFRHRNRVMELIEWAKLFSQHLIVVAPLYNESIYQKLKGSVHSIIPIDTYTTMYLKQVFYLPERVNRNPVTASWSLSASEPYFYIKDNFEVFYIKGIAPLENIVKEIEKTFVLTINKDGSQNIVFKKLKGIINDILSIPIPLELYERLRDLDGKPKVIDIIRNVSRTFSWDYSEKKLFEHILPQLIRDITTLYNLLFEHPNSPKGEVLLQLLSNDFNKKVMIVVLNKYVAQELKIWIRTKKKVSSKDVENIIVVTQEQWAKNQLNEIYYDPSFSKDQIILVNPWKLKYLSSFYTPHASNVLCIAYEDEVNLYRHQINKVHTQNSYYIQDLKQSFISVHRTDFSSLNLTEEKKPRINTIPVNVNQTKIADFSTTILNESVDEIFNDSILFSMIGEQDDEVNLQGIQQTDEVNEKIIQSSLERGLSEYTLSIKLEGIFPSNPDNLYNWFIPCEKSIKIIRNKTIVNVNPLELKSGDIWVVLKHDQRKELFDNILKLSSNTMVMKWIELNVSEWRDMIRTLWHQFHQLGTYKKYTYEKILKAIKSNGGNVVTTYTIANWINGDVSSVRYAENVRAVALIIGEKNYMDKWRVIHKAMRRLWNIHIKLGKILGNVISNSVIKNSEDISSGWVDVGLGIKLSLDEIMASIQLIEIRDIETNNDYLVENNFIEMSIKIEKTNLLLTKGLIKVV